MRLWHESLLPLLPRQQLLGQHRECCALRGNGWGKPHATVNYVFNHPYYYLYIYHMRVMEQMLKRGYHPDPVWFDLTYRGQNHAPAIIDSIHEINQKFADPSLIYPEHDNTYLIECIKNLATKGVTLQNLSKIFQ